MPIYEYQCLKCGKRSELLQSMGAAPLAACPECGGEVKKLISSPAVQFKGSGWYVSDYGKGGAKRAEGKSEGGAGSSESTGSSESAKGETKSAESKPSESKSSESKSGESKPAESKPAKSDS